MKRSFFVFVLFAALTLFPLRAYAASELELEAAFASPIMEGAGEQRYDWVLTNDSPYDVQSICLCVDNGVIQELDTLKSGSSVSGWGIIDIGDAEFGRHIRFSADGYADIPNADKQAAQKKITRYVESSCYAVACKQGEAKQFAIPQPAPLSPPQTEEKAEFKLDACAYVQSRAVQSGAENELLVFVKNNGNTDAGKLELLLNKEAKAQADALSAGKSLILRCPVKAENGKAVQPVLRYANDKGKTATKQLEKIQFYEAGGTLSVSLRANDDDPTPGAETELFIEIKNTGEKAVGGIKLYDYRGDPVQIPKAKLKAGESMSVYAQARLQTGTEMAYYARYNGKTAVAAASQSLLISPVIPEGTAEMKLKVLPDKAELKGDGRDMVTVTCTLTNSGSYTLSGVLLKNGEQVIGSRAVLPAGQTAVFKSAYRLTGTDELFFTATAADETGQIRECSAAVSLRAGKEFIKNTESD